MRTFIVAEAGVNHNGDLDRALRLIDAAAQAGADAVKFQTFRASALASHCAPKAQYQLAATDKSESQHEMLRKLELTAGDHERLIAHAASRGLAFLSTPFDVASLLMLTERFALQTIKVPSGEITNAPFLLAVARAAPRVILSTGMSTLEEVEAALGVLAFGFLSSPTAIPTQADFASAFASTAGHQALRERMILLHCTTEYPAPIRDVNLRAMSAMASVFALPVGYSDHTSGIYIALAAVALGAGVIEKHFTLDRNLPGPDHKASLEPPELRELVLRIREVEQSLGDGIKRPAESELKNRAIARRSLVAARAIEAGEVFTEANLLCKRPGTGVPPFSYWQYLGRQAVRSYEADELID